MSGQSANSHREGLRRPSAGTSSMALSTVLMMVGLTLSKLTGFLRENFIGATFGFGTVASDAFYLGFIIPDLFFQLLVGGSIQAAITPSLSRAIEVKENKRGWRSVSTFITLMTLIMLGASILGMLTSGFLFPLLYSKKPIEVTTMAASISRVLFPQVFFMMLAAFCIGILNAYKKFSSTAFGPTIYNICVLLSIAVLGRITPNGTIFAAFGVMLSALTYFLWQLFMARHEVRFFRPSLNLRDEGFRELFRIAVPTMISASIVQINTIIITTFTDPFSDGIIQSLNNAKTIWQIPYGIFAVAVGSVMLPSLAAKFAAKDDKGARVLLAQSLRKALFLTVPSACLLFSLSYDVVCALLRWSSRDSDTSFRTTSLLLMGYCVAIIAQTFVFIYNQAFYSIGKTKVPLLTGVISMLIILSSCVLLKSLGFLSSDNLLGPMWLSVAYSFASVVTAVILVVLYRKNPQLAPRGIPAFLVRLGICSSTLLLVVYTLNSLPVSPESKVLQLLWVAFRGGAAFTVYLMTAKVLHMRELSSFLDRFSKRRPSMKRD